MCISDEFLGDAVRGPHLENQRLRDLPRASLCDRNMAKSVGNFLRVSAGGTFSPSGLFGNDAEILGVVLTLGHGPALFQIGNGQSIVPSRSVTADVVALCLSQTC